MKDLIAKITVNNPLFRRKHLLNIRQKLVAPVFSLVATTPFTHNSVNFPPIQK